MKPKDPIERDGDVRFIQNYGRASEVKLEMSELQRSSNNLAAQ